MSLWQNKLRENFRNWSDLAEFLQINPAQGFSKSHFPLNLPRRLANKIEKGQLDDPILRQFLPVHAENMDFPGFSCDPLEEKEVSCTSRLLRKYHGRALLITTSACAMHCRYCFRRHFEYAAGASKFTKELDVLRRDSSITELILSGGDPLSLTNSRLDALLYQINSIEHIQLLRFHTRFPLGIPERIDQEFLSLLRRIRAQVWFVIHCNHPRELDDDILKALTHIRAQGIPVLNQTVLLAGVNDCIETLSELCMRLVRNGIQPYYLHQLDRVQGAAHFESEARKGQQLIKLLRERLPGYAVPQYATERPGAKSKTVLT